MKYIKGAISTLALTAGILYGERVADPLDWHVQEYTLEGPQRYTEGFYVSTNYYDHEGRKHDDRVGDGILALTALSGVTRVIIAIAEFGASNKKILNTQDPFVT